MNCIRLAAETSRKLISTSHNSAVKLVWGPAARCTEFSPELLEIKIKKKGREKERETERCEESAPGPVVMLMSWILEMWARLPCHIVWCLACYPSYPGGGLCFQHLFTLICTRLPFLSQSYIAGTSDVFHSQWLPTWGLVQTVRPLQQREDRIFLLLGAWN